MAEMRRKFLLIPFFFSLSLFVFSETGLGGAFSYNVSTHPVSSASFTARSDDSPWCIFFNAGIEKKFVTAFLDNWFINERISEHAEYYVLWGLSFGAEFDDDEDILAAGSRLGAGLDFFFFDRKIEVFAQTVFEPYYGARKTEASWKPFIRLVNFPCSAGLRLWF